MNIEEAKKDLKYVINPIRIDDTTLKYSKAVEFILSELEKKEAKIERLKTARDNWKKTFQQSLDDEKKKDKRISDLEFALMDMVLQFADENKDSINTIGLSALEIAFGELDFDNPMPIKEVHKRYKKLAQEYYKVEREGK